MRPIDADVLKELLIETLERIAKMPTMSHEEMHVIAACRMHCEMIDDTPTLDYAPVVHGAWMFTVDHPRERLGFFACSECGIGVGLKTFNFCPNCGAKMDGGKEHG